MAKDMQQMLRLDTNGSGRSAGESRKSTRPQHQAMSRKASSRLLAELMPRPGGLAASQCSTYASAASA